MLFYLIDLPPPQQTRRLDATRDEDGIKFGIVPVAAWSHARRRHERIHVR